MRLIDADKLENELMLNCSGVNLYSVIEDQPTIDPESLRPRGHWEKETVDGPDVVKYTSLLSAFCSRCGRRAWTKSNYCPHCGAKMED